MHECCHKCNSKINNERFINCSECKLFYHRKCTNANQETIKWTCVTCNNMSDNTAKILEELRANTSALQTFKQTMEKSMNDLKETVEEIKKSQEFISDQYDKMNTQLTDLVKQIGDLNKSTKSSEEKCKELESSLATLQQKTSKLEQQLLSNCLIVNGLRKTDNEVLVDRVLKICDALKVKILKSSVVSAFRGKSGYVFVEFAHKGYRDLILNAKRGKKIYNTDIGIEEGPNDQIYLNEKLTSENIVIFNKARELKKLDYKHVWIKNGTILVKKTDESKPRMLSTLQEAQKFVKIAERDHLNKLNKSGEVDSPDSPNSPKRSKKTSSPKQDL